MKYALFSVPVGTIYDLPQTIKEGEAGLVSTIGDEGLYGQACQVRTAPGGVTAAGVLLPPDVAEVVSFYGYHGYVNRRELQFVREEELWEYLGADLVLVGRATDVLSLPKVQGVRMLELERGGVLRRQRETARRGRGPQGLGKGPADGWPDGLRPGCGAGAGAVRDDGGVLPERGPGLQRRAG